MVRSQFPHGHSCEITSRTCHEEIMSSFVVVFFSLPYFHLCRVIQQQKQPSLQLTNRLVNAVIKFPHVSQCPLLTNRAAKQQNQSALCSHLCRMLE